MESEKFSCKKSSIFWISMRRLLSEIERFRFEKQILYNSCQHRNKVPIRESSYCSSAGFGREKMEGISAKSLEFSALLRVMG